MVGFSGPIPLPESGRFSLRHCVLVVKPSLPFFSAAASATPSAWGNLFDPVPGVSSRSESGLNPRLMSGKPSACCPVFQFVLIGEIRVCAVPCRPRFEPQRHRGTEKGQAAKGRLPFPALCLRVSVVDFAGSIPLPLFSCPIRLSFFATEPARTE